MTSLPKVGDRVRSRTGARGVVVERRYNGWITIQWDTPLCDGSTSVSDVPVSQFDRTDEHQLLVGEGG